MFVLIWGVSGSGKSQYCKWLARRGYRYLDHDIIGQHIADRTVTPLESLWWMFRGGQVSSQRLVDGFGEQPTVVEFGARPDQESLVQLRLLIDLGASAWWFDGDRTAARDSWLEREVPADLEFWRIQTAWVDAAWPAIADILRSRIVRTIGPDRAYLLEAQVDRLMFGDLPDQAD